MNVHCFIARDCGWCLRYHLRAYSAFCDKIVVALDRSPDLEPICREFGCEVLHLTPPRDLPDHDRNGNLHFEGIARQLAWCAAEKYRPDWIFLGDADEVPTPFVMEWLDSMDPAVDLYYTHWVNLYRSPRQCIGGTRSRWSFKHPDSNKKGFAVRWRPGVEYRYDTSRFQHTRMEPNPLSAGMAVYDSRHLLVDSPKLIHWRFADWDRWQAQGLAKAGGQYDEVGQTHPDDVVDVPAGWHWEFMGREMGDSIRDHLHQSRGQGLP